MLPPQYGPIQPCYPHYMEMPPALAVPAGHIWPAPLGGSGQMGPMGGGEHIGPLGGSGSGPMGPMGGGGHIGPLGGSGLCAAMRWGRCVVWLGAH
eukprot:scaffold11864_cov146-Isochrysis_galbana.AAC.1